MSQRCIVCLVSINKGIWYQVLLTEPYIPRAGYLQFIPAEHGLDGGGACGSAEQLLEETVLVSLCVGGAGHDLTQVLLLAEEHPCSLQQPQSDLLLPQ